MFGILWSSTRFISRHAVRAADLMPVSKNQGNFIPSAASYNRYGAYQKKHITLEMGGHDGHHNEHHTYKGFCGGVQGTKYDACLPRPYFYLRQAHPSSRSAWHDRLSSHLA